MNERGKNFPLAEDQFVPKTHLNHPRVYCSAYGPFTKNKERLKKFKETEDRKYISKNELDKACFQHDIVYGGFKYLSRRSAFYRILWSKGFSIAKNRKYDGYQRSLASVVYKFFNINTSGGAIKPSNLQMNFINQLLKNSKRKE